MFTIRKWTKAVRRENGNWWNLWFDENCANVFCWMQKSTLFHRTFFCPVFVAVVVFGSSFARGVLLLCVCVWSLVTKLYTSRNRWKQDKAINFSMPKCCERIVQPVDNMSLSWPTTVTEHNGKKYCVGSSERLATHSQNLRSSGALCIRFGSTFFLLRLQEKLPKIRNWFNLFPLQYCYFLRCTCALLLQSYLFDQKKRYSFYACIGPWVLKLLKCCWLNKMIDSFHLQFMSSYSFFHFTITCLFEQVPLLRSIVQLTF